MASYTQTTTNKPLNVLCQEALDFYEPKREPFSGMLGGLESSPEDVTLYAAYESSPEDVTLYAAYIGNGKFLFTSRAPDKKATATLERLRKDVITATLLNEVPVLIINKTNRNNPCVEILTLRERLQEQSLAARV